MSTRLALDMGFNMDAMAVTGTNHISSEEVKLRRQIYWALYCTDKLSSSYTGRVCTMLVSSLTYSYLALPSSAYIFMPSLLSTCRFACSPYFAT